MKCPTCPRAALAGGCLGERAPGLCDRARDDDGYRRALRATDPGATPPATKPPSTLRKGATFAAALARWVAAGRPRRTKAEVAAILTICRACPGGHYDPAGPACRHCGCGTVIAAAALGVNLRLKARMATEACPIGAWPAVESP